MLTSFRIKHITFAKKLMGPAWSLFMHKIHIYTGRVPLTRKKIFDEYIRKCICQIVRQTSSNFLFKSFVIFFYFLLHFILTGDPWKQIYCMTRSSLPSFWTRGFVKGQIYTFVFCSFFLFVYTAGRNCEGRTYHEKLKFPLGQDSFIFMPISPKIRFKW